MQYKDFVAGALHGDIDLFYETMRWRGWESDAEKLSVDQGVLVYPFLWAKECQIEIASKKTVSFDELFALNFEMRQKLIRGF